MKRSNVVEFTNDARNNGDLVEITVVINGREKEYRGFPMYVEGDTLVFDASTDNHYDDPIRVNIADITWWGQ